MRYSIFPSSNHELRRILVPAEARRADQFSEDVLGLSGLALMENAGRAVAEALARRITPPARVALVCGGGNNGGDGLVAARHLSNQGFEVTVILVVPKERLDGAASVNLRIVERMNLPLLVVDTPDAFCQLPPPGTFDWLVDAVFGTGLSGPPRGAAAEALAWIAGHGRPVLSVDLPSGLCAQSGRILGQAVTATCTVTFAGSKLGHWLGEGPSLVGELEVVDIGIPNEVLKALSAERFVLGDSELAPAFAPRAVDAHKGTFGQVWVIGGALGRTGAAKMAADAALRAGAGRVTIGTTEEALPHLAGSLYEVMAEALFSERALPSLVGIQSRIGDFQAVALGPGLDTRPEVAEWLAALLPGLEVPLVLDADALNAFAGRPEGLAGRGPRVLTPHPGEAARLLGWTTAEVQGDRLGAAMALAARTGAVTVLKGAHTLVCTPEGALGLCSEGNPGMATAGAGDALTGVIAALLARGIEAAEAAAAGVLWHARAGDLAAARGAPGSLITRDIIASLGEIERAGLAIGAQGAGHLGRTVRRASCCGD